MATNYGTLQVLDTLASQATIAQYGEDRAFAAIQANLDAHNEIVRELVTDLCDFTTDRQRRYGGVMETEMVEADEFGTADAQKIAAGVTTGFPLRFYQYSIQWTRMYMQTRTVAELDAQYVAARQADIKNIQRQIKRGLFTPTNNLTYVDRYVDGVNVPLRALINADGTAIPNDPYGQGFDGATHTHYLAINGLTESAVINLLETVVEHGFGGGMRLYINRAQESAIRGMASFQQFYDPRIIVGDNVTRARGELDVTTLFNKSIGVFASAEVWIKPWIPNGYLFAFDANTDLKPLVYRTRDGANALGNLTIAAEHEHYPLRAQTMDREFGVGVWNRTNGAILYSGGASYTAPVF